MRIKNVFIYCGIVILIVTSWFGMASITNFSEKGSNMRFEKRLLKRCKMKPLPLGSIKPSGWLYNQLRIQANGLSGHLDEFWPDIKNSAWFGGDGDGNEDA